MINTRIIIFMTWALERCARWGALNNRIASVARETATTSISFSSPFISHPQQTHKINVRYDSDNTNYISFLCAWHCGHFLFYGVSFLGELVLLSTCFLFSPFSDFFPVLPSSLSVSARDISNVHLWSRHSGERNRNQKQWRCTTECFMTQRISYDWIGAPEENSNKKSDRKTIDSFGWYEGV